VQVNLDTYINNKKKHKFNGESSQEKNGIRFERPAKHQKLSPTERN
jgi:hypothetical protein